MSVRVADCGKRLLCILALEVLLAVLCQATAQAGDESGFVPIFDGKTLDGWDGNPKFWRVEDGTITGQTTKENPTRGNTFLIWRKGKTADFELKLEFRLFGGNSGIQYRSFEVPGQKWVVGGYQADFEAGEKYSGILYGERARGILALRGQKTVIGKDRKPKVVGSVGDPDEIQSKIKKEDWNKYHIIARGNHLVHKINGVTTVDVTDEDEAGAKRRAASGILALQLHQGPPMKVQFRNIRIKHLKVGDRRSQLPPAGKAAVRAVSLGRLKGENKKKIVLIAGPKSHGYGAHEHRAGCTLLAEALNESGLPVQAEVHTGGWPKDARVLDDADTIVIYADGGGRHPFNAHIDELDKLMKAGVGMVCMHYAVEVPQGKPSDALLDWIGGYFEANWSVNPHWIANYKKFPKHPITNGVGPFSMNDEWYYHMRFRKNMQGVTPILSDLPPAETLKRKDGPHSNNPYVREAVLEKKQPQHLAWAYQRPDGGRGFGFTGGHFHWNWGHDDFRKLVLNAIVWTAGVDVPEDGVPSKTPTVTDLEANQDYPQPANFDRGRIQKMLDEWNRAASAK